VFSLGELSGKLRDLIMLQDAIKFKIVKGISLPSTFA
jgi:hypothetical protein